MSQETAFSSRSDVVCDDDQRQEASDTASERASTGKLPDRSGSSTAKNIKKYLRECPGLINAEHFGAMAEEGKNLVLYDQNHF